MTEAELERSTENRRGQVNDLCIFVEMHFAGLPVLPAPETPVGLTDPGGSPSR